MAPTIGRMMVLALLAVPVAGCGPMTDGTGPDPDQASVSFNAAAPSYVRTISIAVSGSGIAHSLVFNFLVDSTGTAHGALTVPAGSDRRIVGRAFDSLGVNTHEGDTTVTLVPGANPSLSLILRPLADTVAIVVTFGSYSIAMTPGDTSVGAAATIAYSAVVHDELGHVVVGAQVRWASSNPAVASVDSVGHAVALAGGTTQISVEYGGATTSHTMNVGPVVGPSTWVLDTTAPAGALAGVWGTGATNVHVVGPNLGQISHYDGVAWSIISSGTPDGLSQIWGLGPNDGYAAGGNFAGTANIEHWDGTSWTSMAGVPGSHYMAAVWGTADNDLYAGGGDGGNVNSAILHYDGTSWTYMTDPSSLFIQGMWGVSDSFIVATCWHGGIIRYNGTSWNIDSSGTAANLWSVWGSSPTNVYAVGDSGTVLRFNGSTWSRIPLGVTVSLRAIAGTGPANIVIAGDDGTILHFDGTSWTSMPSGTTNNLYGVSAVSSTQFIATGTNGTVLWSH